MRTRTINFQYKGQMIKYFNKVANADNVTSATCGVDGNGNYFVTYYTKKF